MKIRSTLICAALVITPSLALAAEPHADVKKAMDYALPELTCKQPVLPGVGLDVVDSDGSVNRAGLDKYKLGRYERAEKRWMKCVTKYKSKLMKDFETLKSSASHGLTQTQAKAIMTNMKSIQLAIESPTGEPIAPNS